MVYQRLPETTQTLYAELLEQVIHAEAEAVVGSSLGTFVSKQIKGGTYWYFQRQEGDRKRQHYLGRESDALLAWMDEVRQARERSAADEAQRARLTSMLAAGGAATESASVGKVLLLLADSGVFRLGGVLVGTQAFRVYGNLLGIRFEGQSLRTQDVDLAQDRAIGIALSQETGAGLGFFPVPGLDHKQPSTSFKIRGRELRVDFLTPLFGPESSKPVFLPSLGVAAHPLRLLDYLIEEPAQAVVVAGPGILANVPHPARFAFHKLWISRRRPVAEQAKAAKDLRQAGELLDVLLEDRPGDLGIAWEALQRHGAAAKSVQKAIERLDPELRERLRCVVSQEELG
ncbi:MAG: GSU2403 family nucleotidyltransferase fold protein [Thermoanaerobaculia bacterium]